MEPNEGELENLKALNSQLVTEEIEERKLEGERRIVDEKINFNIPVKVTTYEKAIMWGDLIKTEGPLPTDVLSGINWRKEQSGFGGMDSNPDVYLIPMITIIRKRPETDSEYLLRKQVESKTAKNKLEKDRLEYLRLKAIFG